MIFIQRGMEPEILNTQGKAHASELCTAYERDADSYDKGKLAFDFDSDIYGHATVKTALNEMQNGKCCFCESKIMHISFGDVEHYRPKAGYKQAALEKKLKKPGYYWLAYNWENLLLCCERCNRQYKKNLFPLLHPENRARNHGDDITAETPLLINPAEIDPQEHIGFRNEIPHAIENNLYGKTTIKILALAREDLNEQRRTKLAQLIALYNIVNIAEARPHDQELKVLADQAKQLLGHAALPNAEYSAMAKFMGFSPTIAQA
jgi:uncharacterized protein (TIGR02646 family)